jgi:hypothetical protein
MPARAGLRIAENVARLHDHRVVEDLRWLGEIPGLEADRAISAGRSGRAAARRAPAGSAYRKGVRTRFGERHERCPAFLRGVLLAMRRSALISST